MQRWPGQCLPSDTAHLFLILVTCGWTDGGEEGREEGRRKQRMDGVTRMLALLYKCARPRLI